MLWKELSGIAKIKKSLTASHCELLSLLIGMVGYYLSSNTNSSTPFLQKITNLLPSLKELTQRSNIAALITRHHQQLGLGEQVVTLVQALSQTTQAGLAVEMDYSCFFAASSSYKGLEESALSTGEEEYFIYNLLCFLDNADLSVRRAVAEGLNAFLGRI